MIQKKRFQAIGLACLIGLVSLAPAVEGLAAGAWSKSGGVYVGADGTAIAGVVARGIDVSHWKESINWNTVAGNDIQFVMLGTRYDSGVDPYFKTNAEGAAAAGLKVGAYLYSYATTTDMAAAEADFVLNLIKDYPISYPVVFDVEASVMSTLSPGELSNIINTFCKKIKDAGYYPMLYANDYWLTSKIDMTKVKYDVWVARYEGRPTYSKASMWQATNKGAVNGISGEVDINFAYKDFGSLIPANLWRQIGGNWYYYANYTMQKGWVDDGNGWYYMKDDGTQHKGWLHINDKYYYLDDSTGKMITGWRKDPSTSKWYYFGPSGDMQVGWVNTDGKWYYMNNDGTMVTEWLKIGDNTYYYLKDDGSMATGWYEMDNAWYYFNPTGELLRGWSDIGGSRYLLGDDGKMFTNWQQINNIWYYFGSDGAMRTGWQQLDGVWYYLNESGQMLTGWQKIDGEYYYLHEGKMLTGWLSDSNGNKYYMDSSSGKMALSWKQIDGSWYYFDQYGHMKTGWLNLSGKYYYLDPETGKMAENVARVIGNVNYTFDKNGVCQNETNNMSGISDSYFDINSVKNSNDWNQNSGQTTNQNSSPAGGNTSVPGTSGSPQNGSSPNAGNNGSSQGPTGGNVTTGGSSGSGNGSFGSNIPAPGTTAGSSGSYGNPGSSGTSGIPGNNGSSGTTGSNSGSSTNSSTVTNVPSRYYTNGNPSSGSSGGFSAPSGSSGGFSAPGGSSAGNSSGSTSGLQPGQTTGPGPR